MIQANELRLNNWVQKTIDGVIRYGVIAAIFDTEPDGNTEYDPIPLTLDVFWKCPESVRSGLDEYGNWAIERIDVEPDIWQLKIHHYLENCDEWGSAGMPTIRYLHEFQNAYFVITGKELDVKLYNI